MFRNMLMLLPAAAFALPFVTAQARPLATPAPQAEWGKVIDDDDDKGNDLYLEVCMETQIFVGEGDRRDFSCDIVSGPQCLSNCTAAAVAPLCESLQLTARSGDLVTCQEERLASCRAQCETDGAAFCSPKLEARGLLDDDDDHWKDDDDDHWKDDDDDHDVDTIVFIEQETCFELDLNN